MKISVGSRSVTAFAVALLFTACVHGAAANAAQTIRLVFPTTPTTAFLPFYIAQKKGWLADLDIKETYVTGDSNAVRAVLSGNADIGTGIGTFSVLSAFEAGADVKAVGSWSPIGDYNVVIAQGKGSKVSDLAGKVFASSGPGALPEQLPRVLMRKYNVDASKSRFIQVGGHSARLQAVLAGRADATLVNTITVLNALKAGKVNLITKISNEFPKLGYVWNVVRKSTLSNRDLAAAIQKLTTAGIKGSRYIMQNPDDAAEILHDKVPTIDVALARRVLRDLNKDKVWGTEGGLDPEVAKFTADLGHKLGLLKKPVNASTLLDRRFVDVSLKELGPEK